jgi:heat shock protein HslJ
LLSFNTVTQFIRSASVLFVVALFTTGCSDSTSTPTSPSAANGSSALTASQVAGTWNLATMQVAQEAVQAAPSGYSLTLGDGQLSTRVDCNTCSGRFTIDGQTLTAGPALACTRAACATMAFESAYTSVLVGASTATVSGNTLTLSSSRGVLRFTR